tara:strand:- start:5465 stop:6421 length:957 start_codon:yes stop_codon:yes gene_type:complete
MPHVIKYVDLFCGLGAFHAAFDLHNKSQQDEIYTCVFACDIDDDVRAIYMDNFGLQPDKDIRKIDVEKIPDFDLLCAGFPCQPFSKAGNKLGFVDKKRGDLFYSILEIIDKKHPNTIILENVRNLLTIDKGETFKAMIDQLQTRGYLVNYKMIDSKYYNSPQSRQRVYVICDKHVQYQFSDVKNCIVPVSSIIDYSITDFFDYRLKYDKQICMGSGMMKYKLINKKTGRGGRQGERVYSIHSCGATICASSGGPGGKTGFYDFDGKMRTLSVKETLKMFGFDVSYKFNSVSQQTMLFYLGNSIVIEVLLVLIKDLATI